LGVVFKHLKKSEGKSFILIAAFSIDLNVLTAFLQFKASTCIFVVIASIKGIALIFGWEKWFLYSKK
jgi:hypothetical protein